MSRFPDTEQAPLRLALNGKGLTRADLLKYSPDKLPSNKRLAEETVLVIRLHANEWRPQDFLLPPLLFLYFSFNIPSILFYRSNHCSIRLLARFSCLIYIWFAFECTPRKAHRSGNLVRVYRYIFLQNLRRQIIDCIIQNEEITCKAGINISHV